MGDLKKIKIAFEISWPLKSADWVRKKKINIGAYHVKRELSLSWFDISAPLIFFLDINDVLLTLAHIFFLVLKVSKSMNLLEIIALEKTTYLVKIDWKGTRAINPVVL